MGPAAARSPLVEAASPFEVTPGRGRLRGHALGWPVGLLGHLDETDDEADVPRPGDLHGDQPNIDGFLCHYCDLSRRSLSHGEHNSGLTLKVEIVQGTFRSRGFRDLGFHHRVKLGAVHRAVACWNKTQPLNRTNPNGTMFGAADCQSCFSLRNAQIPCQTGVPAGISTELRDTLAALFPGGPNANTSPLCLGLAVGCLVRRSRRSHCSFRIQPGSFFHVGTTTSSASAVGARCLRDGLRSGQPEDCHVRRVQ